MILRSTILLLACSQAFAQVGPPSAELRETFKLGKHYEKVRMVDDFPVVSSAKVPDAALEEAADIVRSMLVNRPDIIRKLADNRIRLGIMAVSERTCDLPEHSDLEPPEYYNVRARGLGASHTRPCVSCGEENLLHNPGDPYNTESIMVHEFAHAIHMMAVNDLDSTFDQRLKATHEAALKKGLWKDLYAAKNHFEYWAEAVQSWFDTNRENDTLHNHVNTRQELIDYDPALAALCREVFGENEWRYVRSDDPSRKDEAHLKDLDRSKLRTFAWSAEEKAAYDAVEKK